jgi:four helix bundle protein
MKTTRFEDLECWQEARRVVDRVYRICSVEAFNRDYSLTDQIRRASVSAMANIAEGFSRRGNKEFIQFLFIAKSSAAELQSHLYVALDREYITNSLLKKSFTAGCSKMPRCKAPEILRVASRRIRSDFCHADE